MITASYRYAVEPIAELFGIRDLICAEPDEKPDGEFTGRWISENFAAQRSLTPSVLYRSAAVQRRI